MRQWVDLISPLKMPLERNLEISDEHIRHGDWSYCARLSRELCDVASPQNLLLRAEIEAMRKQVAPSAPDGWQPIETAPQTGEQFMVRRKHTPYPIMARYNPEYNWIEDLNGDHLYNLTGWHALPPIDAQENNDGDSFGLSFGEPLYPFTDLGSR